MGTLYSFENALHYGYQLFSLERFCDISVYTGTKPRDAIGCFVFGREKDYWYETCSRRCAQITHQRVTIHARHANVTDDQIGKRFGHADHRLTSPPSRLHLVTF